MTEIAKDSIVNEEFSRLSQYFEDMKENERAVINPLIQNAGFMRATLDELQEIITEQGPVEEYMNGQNQYGMKQSAALQSYNALVKNYTAVIKSLFSLLPRQKEKIGPLEWEPKMTESDLEHQRELENERTLRIKAEVTEAAAYQQWQREQEKNGLDARMSFSQWREHRKEGKI